jgi:basic membrane protein A
MSNKRTTHGRRAFITVALAVVLPTLPLAGCRPATVSKDAKGRGTPALTSPEVRAALVLDIAGVDDKSFNAASWAGLQRAQRELKLGPDAVKYVESKEPSDYKTNLAAFASQNYSVVFAGSYAFDEAVKQVAPQFSRVKFAIIDGNAPDGQTNCAALQFREEQSSFLAGYLAASCSRSKKIGFVGGKDIPLIKKFEAGYRAGARTAAPNVQVLTAYTNDWNDLSKGKSQAMAEYSAGADIVFQAAGKAGLGVIEAAKEKGKGYYAIGVDSDQDAIAPGRVLTSVIKRVDVAVFDTVRRVKDGKFTPGRQVYDLKSGGVGLTEMKYTKKDIPEAVLAKLKTLSGLVASGKVVVPTKMEELASFRPPKL